MADSCRPVSRHGRYNATGPSSVPYGADVAPYGNVDYTPSNDMYTVNQPERPQPERPERPKTSRGRRRRAEPTPRPTPRPSSRRSRQFTDTGQDEDHESYGRPISRVGFSPEATYQYSHDEYSRQGTERRVVNSPCSSPEGDLYQGGHTEQLYTKPVSPGPPVSQPQGLYSPTQQGHHTTQGERVGSRSPGEAPVDRLIISPSNPQENFFRNSPTNPRRSPRQRYGQSPKGHRQSPQHDTHFARPLSRPSSRDFINVSPIQRDEQQIQADDLHHDPGPPFSQDPYSHEGDRYIQGFGENPQLRDSPYRDSPPFTRHQNSPYHESPQFGNSPYDMSTSPTNKHSYGSSPQTYSRPPPSQRPKSARPRTARKKSAKFRNRHEEQQTSQPQMCNTDSILHTGDPYGRPSSSLSRYKPLPAIGSSNTTPRPPADSSPTFGSFGPYSPYTPSEHVNSQTNVITNQTERLNLEDHTQFHPADDNEDPVCAEDIQGAKSQLTGPVTDKDIPDVSMLTNFPRHLSNEIINKSVSNMERNITGDSKSGRQSAEISERYEDVDKSLPKSSRSFEPLNLLHELPKEPSEGESRLLLAVKLPDGRRIQRYFSPTDRLQAVLDFAENESLMKFRDFHLVCNAPRTRFTDLSLQISETGLRDRTVLYLEEEE